LHIQHSIIKSFKMKFLIFIIFSITISWNVNSQNLKNEILSIDNVSLIPSSTQSSVTQVIAILTSNKNNIDSKNDTQLTKIEESRDLSTTPSKTDLVLTTAKANNINKPINVLQTDSIVLKKNIQPSKTIPKVSISKEE
jgi:hypothetical protein